MVDYIRSHVRLCAVLLYSKASSLCYLLAVGWYTWHASQIYICICTYDGIKVGLLYNNAGYVMWLKSIESDSHSAIVIQAL